MLQALLFAALLSVQAKTVEDRLKELDEKIASLEKKQKTLADENAAMEKKLADREAQWEKFARSQADLMAQTTARKAQLSEQQTAELKETWYGWLKEDKEKPGPTNRWVAREAALKATLSAEQLASLVQKVRDEQLQNAKASISTVARTAKLSAEKAAALEKAAVGKITIPEGVVLPFAHPQAMANAWGQVLVALESSIPEVSSTLTEEELQSLRKVLEQWKPRSR